VLLVVGGGVGVVALLVCCCGCDLIDGNIFKLYLMRVKCAECGHLFVGDEAGHHYKGKSYCDDCYEMIKAAEHENQNKNKIISSKMREFGKGFTIPDNK
jgi:hypothetical protein